MSLPISSTFLMSSKSDTSLTFNICKYITINTDYDYEIATKVA
jgi:hypothetical protein